MKIHLPIRAKFSAELIRRASVEAIIPVGTWWEFEHWRKGRLIDQWAQKNVMMLAGFNHMLNVIFFGETPITSWYIGLFEDDYTPLTADTYAVPGFTESEAFTEAARQAYVPAEATAKILTNTATKATFTINATKDIYGAFLCGGGSTPALLSDVAGGGLMFAAAKFAAVKEVVATDILMMSCRITLGDV